VLASLKKLQGLIKSNMQEIHKAADGIRTFASTQQQALGIKHYSANYPKVKEMFKTLWSWQFETPSSLEDEKYIQDLIYWFESRL
jgi:hypothetical protein